MDSFEGIFFSAEYNYICFRNEAGWLLWSGKINEEHNLNDVLKVVTRNQENWEHEAARIEGE